MISLATLKPNNQNPRKITPDAMKKLCASIKRDPQFMALRPIVIDPDGTILGGNQRYAACLALEMHEVPDNWVGAANDLTSEQRTRFILVDNSPGGMAGDWDIDILHDSFSSEDLKLVGLDGIADRVRYTPKIESPLYEPHGECPAISALENHAKTDALFSEIDSAGLPGDVTTFLRRAAERHTVFDFAKIAEYYAHAPRNVQDLMERSALVIIDYDKAIECGFVQLTEKMKKLAGGKTCENSEDA